MVQDFPHSSGYCRILLYVKRIRTQKNKILLSHLVIETEKVNQRDRRDREEKHIEETTHLVIETENVNQ